ncbi:MAG: DNA polymerase III subunit beta [Desulfohalobiaceae bacterium]
MKIKIPKENILPGMQKAASIIPSKAGAAFLRTVWLQAEQDRLTVMSTDSKLEFTGSYSAQCDTPGLVGIQGRNIHELLRKLPAGDIQFRLDQESETLLLEQGKRKYKLPTYDSTWFQHFHQFPQEDAVLWTGAELKSLIDRIAFCIADDNTENMHYLNLVPTQGHEGWIEACGLNGHQFALTRFKNKELAQRLGSGGILIAKTYLLELRKWLDNEELYFNMNEKRLFFTDKEQTEHFSLPLNIDTFPEYSNFLSYFDNENTVMKIDKEEMTEALNRLRIFNTETQQCSYFIFDNSELVIYSEGQETGEATESLQIDYQGDLEKIAFPTRDLIEILAHFDSQTVFFEFTNALGPCRISSPGAEGYFVITMPVDITEEVYYEDENLQ